MHLLDLVAFAYCLLEAAHLSSFRAYNKLFLRLAFHRPGPETSLRAPNVTEMQAADKEAWRCITELTSKGWSLDDALHEVVQVRCILQNALQSRPAPPKQKAPPPPRLPPGQSQFLKRQGQKGGGGRGGKGKGKDKGGQRDGPKWCIEFMDNGKKLSMCKRWNLRSGCKLDDCTFVHGCCVDVGGRPCGKDHPAYMHKAA